MLGIDGQLDKAVRWQVKVKARLLTGQGATSQLDPIFWDLVIDTQKYGEFFTAMILSHLFCKSCHLRFLWKCFSLVLLYNSSFRGEDETPNLKEPVKVTEGSVFLYPCFPVIQVSELLFLFTLFAFQRQVPLDPAEAGPKKFEVLSNFVVKLLS